MVLKWKHVNISSKNLQITTNTPTFRKKHIHGVCMQTLMEQKRLVHTQNKQQKQTNKQT